MPIVPLFDTNEKSASDILLMNTIQTLELSEATFYNDLPQMLEKAWSLLEDAARSRHSPMHTPCWSAGAKITPHAHPRWSCGIPFGLPASCGFTRTAVLPRSKNCTANRRVRCLLITPCRRFSFAWTRLATVHQENDITREIWTQTPLSSRRCYLAQEAPGARAAKPTSGLPTDLENRVPEAVE